MNSEPMLLSHEISALVHHVELNRTGWWDEALSGIVLASVWSLDRPVNAEEIVSELRKSFRLPVGKEQLSLVMFLSGNPGFGGTSKEETLWGMYRACGDQGSGRDKRGFDTPGMHFHSQVAA